MKKDNDLFEPYKKSKNKDNVSTYTFGTTIIARNKLLQNSPIFIERAQDKCEHNTLELGHTHKRSPLNNDF